MGYITNSRVKLINGLKSVTEYIMEIYTLEKKKLKHKTRKAEVHNNKIITKQEKAYSGVIAKLLDGRLGTEFTIAYEMASEEVRKFLPYTVKGKPVHEHTLEELKEIFDGKLFELTVDHKIAIDNERCVATLSIDNTVIYELSESSNLSDEEGIPEEVLIVLRDALFADALLADELDI